MKEVYYSQLSDFNPTQYLVKSKAVNSPIKFEKIVMVMINMRITIARQKIINIHSKVEQIPPAKDI